MDYKVIWDNEAIAELAEAVRFISGYNPVAARKTGEAILQKAGCLAVFPRFGRIYQKLHRNDVRETSVPPYRIFYQINDSERSVRILKIWHGARKEPDFGGQQMKEHSAPYGRTRTFTAIAAMSLNRVIGNGNQIPWHLPEDFKWFKAVTMGHVLVMGRKTFESIGRPLPGRETIVLTRSGWTHSAVKTAPGLEHLPIPAGDPRTVFIAGGAEIYRQALPLCDEMLLTLVKREVEGDAFFPEFEEDFELVEKIRESPEFDILRYARRRSSSSELSPEEQMDRFEDSLKESDWGHQPC